ncbi:hypothetical protein UG55_10048 [Frankia sp. EI5c]|uniref:hypothetical protein n=1 Tax=Frankia sp. EI5c TaxID=683316 RepID=UPI0007C276AC|nr:hypothetical protein [Frankia sp. EI5c]OAA29019.1 hypothetical protein UG55_10048 [Frankia sp. EI5c]
MPRAGSAVTRTRTAAMGVLFMLTAAACGGGNDGLLDDTSADKPIAAVDYLLTEGPETVGLYASATEEGEDDSPTDMFDAELAACLGQPAEAINPPALDTAVSATFSDQDSSATQDETVEAGSLAATYTREQVRTLAAVLAHSDYLTCQNKSLDSEADLESDVEMTELSTPDGALAAYRVTFGDAAYLDMVHFGRGRVFSTLIVNGSGVNGQRPDTALVERLAEQIARKLRDQ